MCPLMLGAHLCLVCGLQSQMVTSLEKLGRENTVHGGFMFASFALWKTQTGEYFLFA